MEQKFSSMELKPCTPLWGAYHAAWSEAAGLPGYEKSVWRDQVADALRRVAEHYVRGAEARDEVLAELQMAMQVVGPMQAIVMPTEPRVWGGWDGERWALNPDGSVFREYSERLVKAACLPTPAPGPKYEAREIGPDGLPAPLENEK